ncbi:MAG: helix-turn-helix domain-containing protein [Gammaproteobacteria bacterium]|nr:helix-turn-helix domain-containing protein [Gammaproteobacteria bacterium]
MGGGRETDAGTSTRLDNGDSIGARLRTAREQRGLSAENVAKQLRLDVAVVNALEHDDREHLPAPIFVQGYLRSYARLLDLPESELADDYARESGELPPLTVQRIGQRRAFFRMPSTGLMRNVILVLFVAIMLWLAFPHISGLFDSRNDVSDDETAAGHLEIPPAGH